MPTKILLILKRFLSSVGNTKVINLFCREQKPAWTQEKTRANWQHDSVPNQQRLRSGKCSEIQCCNCICWKCGMNLLYIKWHHRTHRHQTYQPWSTSILILVFLQLKHLEIQLKHLEIWPKSGDLLGRKLDKYKQYE